MLRTNYSESNPDLQTTNETCDYIILLNAADSWSTMIAGLSWSLVFSLMLDTFADKLSFIQFNKSFVEGSVGVSAFFCSSFLLSWEVAVSTEINFFDWNSAIFFFFVVVQSVSIKLKNEKKKTILKRSYTNGASQIHRRQNTRTKLHFSCSWMFHSKAMTQPMSG